MELLRSIWTVLIVLTLAPCAVSFVLHAATWRGERGLFWWFIFMDLMGFMLVLGAVTVSLLWQPHPLWFDYTRAAVFVLVSIAVYWRLVLQIRALRRKANA